MRERKKEEEERGGRGDEGNTGVRKKEEEGRGIMAERKERRREGREYEG